MQHTVLTVANWLDFGPLKMPQFIKTFFKRYRQYKLYRNTVEELSGLSDRELKDLGIHRCMIHAIALEAYYDNREV